VSCWCVDEQPSRDADTLRAQIIRRHRSITGRVFRTPSYGQLAAAVAAAAALGSYDAAVVMSVVVVVYSFNLDMFACCLARVDPTSLPLSLLARPTAVCVSVARRIRAVVESNVVCM